MIKKKQNLKIKVKLSKIKSLLQRSKTPTDSHFRQETQDISSFL